MFDRHQAAPQLVALSLMALLASSDAFAQASCGFSDRLFRSGFEAGDPPPVALPAADTPLTVSIDPTFQGLVTSSASLPVFGTYSGPPAAGVSVNGRPARRAGAAWWVEIPLSVGINDVTVTVTRFTEGTAQAAVQIERTLAAPATVVGRMEGTQSFAPGQARLRLEPPAGRTILSAGIDLEDDGGVDLVLNAPSPETTTRLSFSQPGLRMVRVAGTLDDGNPQTPTEPFEIRVPVLLEHPGLTRLELCHVYAQMRASLLAGNVAEAVKGLHPPLTIRFQVLWSSLGDDLPEVASQLGEIADGMVATGYAELSIARPVEGTKI